MLSVLVGIGHAAIYVLLRGTTRARLVFIAGGAILGAYAGQALGARLGDPLRVGDLGLVWSSVLAWVGITTVVVVAVLGPEPASAGKT